MEKNEEIIQVKLTEKTEKEISQPIASTIKLGNEQIYELMTSEEASWQAIINDLINTGQLDPWDINLGLLANKYLERIKFLEEANFFISSKVLLVASVLLRFKSDILLYEHVKSIDEILFGKKEEQKKEIEKIEIDENSLPLLFPKTPLPRYRKVTLQELMTALDQAMNTENRRIKREVEDFQRAKITDIVLPKFRVSIRDRIRKIYSQILTAFKKKGTKISYAELTGNNREEKISCFLPCLHLENQQKLFLEQESHFKEIYLWLYEHYKKNEAMKIANQIIDEKRDEIAQETGFDNPLADFFNSS